MNRPCLLLAAPLMWHAALLAQTQPALPDWQRYYQPAPSLAGGRGGRGIAMPPPRSETGKPFSATVTTHTTQTFLDGTRVSQTTTMLQHRDAEGRVRTETVPPATGSSGQTKVITIRDPVAGVSYTLDPAKKSALGLPMPRLPMTAEPAGRRGGRGSAPQPTAQMLQDQLNATGVSRNNPNDIVEDLGTTTVNGVSARGTRITTVVPIGAIGNDREFRSITERWFSPDLNLLIKSVSTDPRFGTTTYELTNISRQPPDPSLFQVPADYNIVRR